MPRTRAGRDATRPDPPARGRCALCPGRAAFRSSDTAWPSPSMAPIRSAVTCRRATMRSCWRKAIVRARSRAEAVEWRLAAPRRRARACPRRRPPAVRSSARAGRTPPTPSPRTARSARRGAARRPASGRHRAALLPIGPAARGDRCRRRRFRLRSSMEVVISPTASPVDQDSGHVPLQRPAERGLTGRDRVADRVGGGPLLHRRSQGGGVAGDRHGGGHVGDLLLEAATALDRDGSRVTELLPSGPGLEEVGHLVEEHPGVEQAP